MPRESRQATDSRFLRKPSCGESDKPADWRRVLITGDVILVGGLPASGKSTMLEALRSGHLSEVSGVLNLAKDCSVTFTAVKELVELEKRSFQKAEDTESSPECADRVVVRVDLDYAFLIKDHRRAVTRILNAARSVTFVTIVASMEDFRARHKLRKKGLRGLVRQLARGGSVKDRWRQIRRRLALTMMFRTERWVLDTYEAWLETARQHGSRNVVVQALNGHFYVYPEASARLVSTLLKGRSP